MKGREPRAHDKSHRDRQIDEVAHDPYHARSKPAEPAYCPQCGLIYHKGRWQRAARMGDALHAAFDGELVIKYSADEFLVRVNWTR